MTPFMEIFLRNKFLEKKVKHYRHFNRTSWPQRVSKTLGCCECSAVLLASVAFVGSRCLILYYALNKGGSCFSVLGGIKDMRHMEWLRREKLFCYFGIFFCLLT